jgi:hypothetical protein
MAILAFFALTADLVQIGIFPPLPTRAPLVTDQPPSTDGSSPVSLTPVPSPAGSAQPRLTVLRNFNGVRVCADAPTDFSALQVTFVDRNEQYRLIDVMPVSRLDALTSAACVCLVQANDNLPAGCTPDNASRVQQTSSDWVNVDLELRLAAKVCRVERTCPGSSECPCQ